MTSRKFQIKVFFRFHIPNNTPYIRYFVSFILQFQFYEHLCIQAGQYHPDKPELGPLYKCDFFNSLEAGTAMSKMLERGQSQPWQLTLNEMLGMGKMSADSLLHYFGPIIEWLEKDQQENGWVSGWDMDSQWTPKDFDKDAYDPNKCA